MQTITLITQKGGSGKSTLAVNLAVTSGRGKKHSLLIDLDPQATAARWYERRCKQGLSKEPGVVTIRAQQLPEALERARAAKIDHVFIDTAGRDDAASTTAIKHADFCLVACRPTTADIEALEPTVRTLHRQQKAFAFVITQAPPPISTKDKSDLGVRTRDARNGLSKHGLVATVSMVHRVAYQDSLGNGQGVLEFDQEGKAAREMIALWYWINRELRKLDG